MRLRLYILLWLPVIHRIISNNVFAKTIHNIQCCVFRYFFSFFSYNLLIVLKQEIKRKNKCGTYVEPSGCKNDIWGFSSIFRCIMALEYSRFSKFFSFSCKFNVCSVFACKPNDFVFPKLNLHIKHISIGFVILAADDVFASMLLPVDEPPLSDVTVLSALTFDGNIHWASHADTTRKEWIFGLFGVTGKWTPSVNETNVIRKRIFIIQRL